MPATTRQMSDLAEISEQTVRNYSKRYRKLLSPQARGETGQLLFDDEDIRVVCTIAHMRRENIPPKTIIERIERGDLYIDHTTPQQATPSEPQAPQTALEAPPTVLLSLSTMQRQIDALQRRQDVLLRVALLWGALWGAIAALVAAGFVLWLMWLMANR